jgi:hypothetical protein
MSYRRSWTLLPLPWRRTSWSYSGTEIKEKYSINVLQEIMDTAPTTVAQDLMVLLRY